MVRGYAGSYAFARYGWQDAGYLEECASQVTIGSDSYTGAFIPFGHDVSVSSWSRNNNLEALYNLGDNQAKSTITKAYEGSFSVEFVLGNGYFWRSILGTEPVNTPKVTGKSWTKTFVNDGATPTIPVSRHPAPFTMDVGMSSDEGNTEGYVYTLIGCLAQSVKLNFSANEPIRVTLDGVYSNEKAYPVDDKVWLQVADTFAEPMAYQNAKIMFPVCAGTGDTIELEVIDSSEITISNNAEALLALGNRKARVPIGKHMEYGVTISAYLTDKVNTDSVTSTNEENAYDMFIQRFYDKYNSGSTVEAPLDQGNVKEFDFEIHISNEYADNNADGYHRGHVIKFKGCSISSMDMPLQTKEAIKLDMTLIVRRITELTYIDATNCGEAGKKYLIEEDKKSS